MEDAAERIYADYRQKAVSVARSQDDWIVPAGLTISVIDLLLFLLLRQEALYMAFLAVAAVAGCTMGVLAYQGKKQYLAQTAERNPGFAEFYQAWRRNKPLRSRDLAEAGEMGVIAHGVAAHRVHRGLPESLEPSGR
jgi:hypothetical protein